LTKNCRPINLNLPTGLPCLVNQAPLSARLERDATPKVPARLRNDYPEGSDHCGRPLADCPAPLACFIEPGEPRVVVYQEPHRSCYISVHNRHGHDPSRWRLSPACPGHLTGYPIEATRLLARRAGAPGTISRIRRTMKVGRGDSFRFASCSRQATALRFRPGRAFLPP
jgi:hypothetical protein